MERPLNVVFYMVRQIDSKSCWRDNFLMGLDKQGVSRRVGFVRYDNNEHAQMAVATLNGHIPDGEPAPIYVKVCRSPGSAVVTARQWW